MSVQCVTTALSFAYSDVSVCYGFNPKKLPNSVNVSTSAPFSHVTGRYMEGTVANYICASGYAPVDGVGQSTCTNGAWVPARPACGEEW